MSDELQIIKTESGRMLRKGTYPIDETFEILGDTIYERRKTFVNSTVKI